MPKKNVNPQPVSAEADTASQPEPQPGAPALESAGSPPAPDMDEGEAVEIVTMEEHLTLKARVDALADLARANYGVSI